MNKSLKKIKLCQKYYILVICQWSRHFIFRNKQNKKIPPTKLIKINHLFKTKYLLRVRVHNSSRADDFDGAFLTCARAVRTAAQLFTIRGS